MDLIPEVVPWMYVFNTAWSRGRLKAPPRIGLPVSCQDAAVAVDLQPRTGSMVSAGFDGMVEYPEEPLAPRISEIDQGKTQ